MAPTKKQSFILDAVQKDGVAVVVDNDDIAASRDLSDDKTELSDVLDLADKHGPDVTNVVTDMQKGETRVVFSGGESA